MPNKPVIIFENESFAVIDKPVGLTVNKSNTTAGQATLQDWIEKKIKYQKSNIKNEQDGDFYKRAGIVHRLDKDTSGVILVAKTPEAFANLQLQFKNRVVAKTYIALVWGKLTGVGEINAPITRNPYNRYRFGVFVGGKEARTNYKVFKNITFNGKDLTLVEAYPHTGRTHQIRVHFTYIGHPIVGDPLYSGRKKGREGQDMFKRLLLHAYKIKFNDINGKPVEFTTDIPQEFRKVQENQ